jgi:hypothetical protein
VLGPGQCHYAGAWEQAGRWTVYATRGELRSTSTTVDIGWADEHHGHVDGRMVTLTLPPTGS